MKIVIPVAGIGKRLRPHTYSLPKPLLHVAGKPILSHLLDPVVQLDPDEVIFVVGYKGDQIREFVDSTYSFKSKYVKQDDLLGLGFALNLAMQEVANSDVLIILGDTVVDCDLQKFVSSGDYVLGLRKVDDPRRFGIAVVENNVITNLEEKPENPKGDQAIIGLYYFREVDRLKDALSAHVQEGRTTRGEIQFTDALQKMITDGIKFVPYEVEGWYDCGKKETMLDTNRQLLLKMNQQPEAEGSVLVPPVFVAASARVVNSVIGPNVSVSENSVIERSIIADSIIGSRAQLTNVVMRNSLVGHDVIMRNHEPHLNIGDSSSLGVE
jgi:glucose-1-phosphate thymidylyltransferase